MTVPETDDVIAASIFIASMVATSVPQYLIAGATCTVTSPAKVPPLGGSLSCAFSRWIVSSFATGRERSRLGADRSDDSKQFGYPFSSTSPTASTPKKSETPELAALDFLPRSRP